ncbi:DUF6383 domain-containing protein [Parabacteroides sp.]
MNKKFSTLMTMGLLAVGTLFGTANAQVSKTVNLLDDKVGDNYYYVGTTDGASFLKAVEVKNTNGSTYTSLDGTTTATSDVDYCLFKIEVVSKPGLTKDKLFRLKNKETGQYVTFKAGNSIDATNATSLSTISAGDNEAARATYVNTFSLPTTADYTNKEAEVTAGTGMTFIPFTGAPSDNTNQLSLAAGAFSVVAAGSGTALQFFGVADNEVFAVTLNNTLKNGFVFNSKDVKENIFAAQTVKAFEVTSSISLETAGYTIPAGTYFAIAYPKELANTSAIANADDFKKCTFIVADPATTVTGTADDRKAGKNFGFKTLAGDDFNFYTVDKDNAAYDAEKAPQGTQVSVHNAIFEVWTNKDNEYKYAIEIPNFYYKKAAGTDKPEQGVVKAQIASSKVDNVQTLMTTTGNTHNYIFTFGDAPVVKPIDLLNDSTASVYNIRFVSGDKADTEKGKYLTAGTYVSTTNTHNALMAVGSAVAMLEAPQYQFVISDVNVEDKLVTFMNRETGTSFVCNLFSTDDENVYYVASAKSGVNSAKFAITDMEKDGSVNYLTSNNELTGKTIELIAATVDKLAGFANRDENAGYTYIKFALDNVSNDNMYMMVRNVGTTTAPSYKVDKSTPKEGAADLFELVKSEKPVYYRNNYAYAKDGVPTIKLKGDTIAYYTYAIKWINPSLDDDTYYVKGDLTVATATKAENADQFVIRKNYDGSVSIVKKNDMFNGISNDVDMLNAEKNGNVSFASDVYTIAGAKAVKSFLKAEDLGASLAAKEQHAAFQTSLGGYMSMNSAAEGVVAIKTAADEDLTFWLDTADTKSVLPSFYLSKAAADPAQRMYMYYAVDSASYYINNPHYNIDTEHKMIIFKAATLVSPDTLATTVNGKAVNVAAKPDAAGTLGGLNYFRFQIFKLDNASDEYVIRCRENNLYVSNINGMLTLDSQDKALKVIPEEGMIPTDNESIDAESAVKVIAGNGTVTIQGAAGQAVKIATVLGKPVANEVVASDNATIAAPAGVVFVTVNGETTKVVVK